MQIDLKHLFAPTTQVDEYDVKQLKKALNRLGYYQPYDKVGITEVPDQEIFEAIAAFQRDQNLTISKEIRPGDETVLAINTALNQKKSGKYIWRIVEDGNARPSHAQYNRTVRQWEDAPDPGDDFNCRCWAQPYKDVEDIYDPPLEPVYPELLLLPLLRVNRLYVAWSLWLDRRNTEWVLGAFKSEIRWGNQLRNRDWTPEQITETLQKGKRYPAPNKVNPGNPATRYEYKDRFIVRDEKTKEILQISGDAKFRANKIGE